MTQHSTRPSMVTRRAVLLGGAAVLAGCTGRQLAGPNPDPAPSASARVAATPPPLPPPYRPEPGEPLPQLKLAAGLFVQALATSSAEGAPANASGLPRYAGPPGELALAQQALRRPGHWSRGEIELVQLGGLVPVSPQARSGVGLVLLRQTLQSLDGGVSVLRRTVDVRLSRLAGQWQVTGVGSVGGAPLARPAGLAPEVIAALDDGRIDLPDTARWDIYAGRVSPVLLAVLSELAGTARLGVTVLKTGHPRLVVDGRRSPPVSAHFLGLAADIFSLDGTPVSRAPAATVQRVVDHARSLAQVRQLGVPVGQDADGPRRRIFSNLVHADHLHVAVGEAGDRRS